MDLVKLTTEQRGFFEENGYLIVPGALDEHTIEQVTAAADSLMQDFEYEGHYQHRRIGLMQNPTIAKLATNSPIASLFESRTYHSPAINSQDHIAKTAMFGYHYYWIQADHYLQYHDGQVQPDATVLANLDDVGRQLLGATVDSKGREAPNGLDWPIAEWAKEHRLSLERAPQRVDQA